MKSAWFTYIGTIVSYVVVLAASQFYDWPLQLAGSASIIPLSIVAWAFWRNRLSIFTEWKRTWDPNYYYVEPAIEVSEDYRDRSSIRGAVTWSGILFCLVLAVFLLGVWPFIIAEAKAPSLGDSFGLVNTLFSGLAFVGVIVAIVLQTVELRYQREEMNESQTIWSETSKTQERAMRLQRDAAYAQMLLGMPSLDDARHPHVQTDYLTKALHLDRLELEVRGAFPDEMLLSELSNALHWVSHTLKAYRDSSHEKDNRQILADLAINRAQLVDSVRPLRPQSLCAQLDWITHHLGMIVDHREKEFGGFFGSVEGMIAHACNLILAMIEIVNWRIEAIKGTEGCYAQHGVG